MQNDVDRMRELSHAGLLDGAPRKPETHQFGLVEELLSALLATVQRAVSEEGTRITAITPRTARDVLDAETADADEAVIFAAMVEVSDEDYRAWVAQG